MIYRVSFVCTGAGRQVISGAKSFKWKRVWASQLSAESSWAGHTSAGLVGLDGLCPTRAAGKPRHVGGTKMIWFWTIHFPHENWSLSHCHIRRRPDCRSIWNWWYIYMYMNIHPHIYIYTYICMDLYIHPYGYILFRQVCEDFQRAHRPRKCSRSQGVTMGHCPKKNWTRWPDGKLLQLLFWLQLGKHFP